MPATVTALDSTNGSGGTTCALNPASQVNVGDFIVVTVAQRDHTLSSVADNSSQAGAANTYTLAVSQDDGTGDGKTAIYYCRVTRAILTSNAITVTLATGGGTFFCTLLKLDPIVSASPLDQTGSTNVGGTTTWSMSTSGATTQADEVAVGVMNHWGSGAEPTNPVPDSPWVEAYDFVSGGAGVDVAYRILSAAGTITFSGAWGVSMDNDGSGCIATFKAVVDAAVPRNPAVNFQDPGLLCKADEWVRDRSRIFVPRRHRLALA